MKKTLLISALALATSFSQLAQANESHQPKAQAWTLTQWNETARQMPQGNSVAGAKLHKYALCITCHGENGVAPSRNAPSLAGNLESYTFKTLKDYQSGLRNEGDGKSDVMRAAAHHLTDQDMADLASFYAEQKAQAKVPEKAVSKATLRLVKKGDVSRMITPCASCHGVHGEGHDLAPALAGQTAHYFVRTMQAYKNLKRTNDINAGMAQFTYDLTDEEIQALADYYATLNK
jgi:cytochrome c553